MFAPWMKFYLQDEASDGTTGGGGGGDMDLSVDIDTASDAIGADLGLNEGEGTDSLLDGSATPPKKEEAKLEDKTKAAPPETPEVKAAREAREKAVAATGKKPAAELKPGDAGYVAPQKRAVPKSWKPEFHSVYEKLPLEAQNYIDQREAEVEAGFKQYGETASYGKGLKEVLDPYQPLLAAQGITDQRQAVKFLMNAHYTLSTADDAGRARFLATLAKSYRVDLTKALEHSTAAEPQLSAAERALQDRVNALESDRKREQDAAFASVKASSAKEVEAFASNPAHPYFDEVSREIVLLMNDPKVTLEKAYEMAVYANPVTREKEMARLRTEAETKTRKEAEEAAKAAEKARGTRIKGDEKERASPDLLGSMEETMRDTMSKIKHRQEN